MLASGLIRMDQWKRLAMAALVMAALATVFWTTSRYPSLDEKAMMGGAIQLEDPLGFEALIALDPAAPVVERVAVSTVNWINTNKKGMMFGWLFGAAFLTLLGYFRRRNFKGRFANSFYGMVIGAPLGVCVNCAAPIARGLFQGGSRAETTLSAMIASPTLNVVVLTMAFSLLPFYIAVTKLVLSLAVILLAVPLICRVLPQERLLHSVKSAPAPQAPDLPEPELETLTASLVGFVTDFGRNFWFILRMTAPLMLLAGFLGAIAATLLPVDLINGREFGLVSALAAGVVGTFLPVPIGFDVVVSGALLNGGVGHGFIMTLVFTLGSFSVYSFMIVATSVGWRAAGLLAATVCVLGVGSGVAIDAYHDYQTRRAIELLTGAEEVVASAPGALNPAISLPVQDPTGPAALQTEAEDDVELERLPYGDNAAYGDAPFTRMEAWQLGIDHAVEFSMGDMWPPFWEGRSVASGDIDRDGDIDLVFASTRVGLYIYRNDGAGGFSGGAVDAASLRSLPIFNAALMDVDNDGFPDLFLTTFREGNFILPNDGGQFAADRLRPVANRDDAILTLAASFADVDRDGDLDIALGNWAAGWYRRIPGEESRNRIILNDDGALSGQDFRDLPGIPGETLSILFSDLDADGAVDLLVGNDFEVPDYAYFGDGAGQFTAVTHQDGLIPMTTNTTMSVSSFDLRNTGQMALYFAQIAGRAEGVSDRLRMQPIEQYCDGIERDLDREICQRNMAIKVWYRSGNSLDPSNARRCSGFEEPYRSECRGMMLKDLAIQDNNPEMCAIIPVGQTTIRALCDVHFLPSRAMTAREQDEALPQILSRNVLLERGGQEAYAETAQAMHVEVGGWSWDVSHGDFDNDGWQDMYIVNGTWVPNEVTPSNIFLRNQAGERFEEVTETYGLGDFAMTAAATLADIDNDGDLDVIAVPVNAPVTAFLNNSGRSSISFRLVDERGNRDGIGARIEIRHAGFGTGLQTREIQLGGGFMSFDAPIAHFGLGDLEQIDSASIRWADGRVTQINEPLEAGATYRVHRRRHGRGVE
ncbi:FG-GAP-like repeat-containing protein [Maricaulis sp.]|uniref:FG-GAP-like repeat-containing protein n=2 Tax=Maricaulis TaxID=74317 RepID=UPI0026357CB3|nr:FG-GAP-like repeat-containing protein [Maricaulis sp.]MDF1767933.1 FG-GAP-like repeat-containing protein [Maricaulis sp.]